MDLPYITAVYNDLRGSLRLLPAEEVLLKPLFELCIYIKEALFLAIYHAFFYSREYVIILESFLEGYNFNFYDIALLIAFLQIIFFVGYYVLKTETHGPYYKEPREEAPERKPARPPKVPVKVVPPKPPAPVSQLKGIKLCQSGSVIQQNGYSLYYSDSDIWYRGTPRVENGFLDSLRTVQKNPGCSVTIDPPMILSLFFNHLRHYHFSIPDAKRNTLRNHLKFGKNFAGADFLDKLRIGISKVNIKNFRAIYDTYYKSVEIITNKGITKKICPHYTGTYVNTGSYNLFNMCAMFDIVRNIQDENDETSVQLFAGTGNISDLSLMGSRRDWETIHRTIEFIMKGCTFTDLKFVNIKELDGQHVVKMYPPFLLLQNIHEFVTRIISTDTGNENDIDHMLSRCIGILEHMPLATRAHFFNKIRVGSEEWLLLCGFHGFSAHPRAKNIAPLIKWEIWNPTGTI
jgi:hypothetical protein